MPKNIVICSDGTGNTAIKGRGTNVFKLYEAVDLHGHEQSDSLIRQIAFYDDGVGTEAFKPLRLLGGAVGLGMSRNIRRLYADLVRTYEPGDKIYLFGFSRGAYTVRALAGLITACGVLDRRFENDDELEAAVRQAYGEYRRKYRTMFGRWIRRPYRPEGAEAFRRQYGAAPGGEVEIEFVGVWDTVDAVGLPDDLAEPINALIYPIQFPDLKLSHRVKRACHALSIDDERRTFRPVMWDEEGERPGRIEQVWFAGVHANVGGGYPKQGISLVALDWMMAQAELVGLRFLPRERTEYREHRNVNDNLYDSRAGLAVYYRYAPRDIAAICREHHSVPHLHVSALDRIAEGTGGYAPGNIPMTPDAIVTDKPGGEVERAEAVLRGALSGSDSLLAQLSSSVRFREYAHYLFMAFSALGVAAAATVVGPTHLLEALGSTSGLLHLAWALLSTRWGAALLLQVLIFWTLGTWAQRSMSRNFSTEWLKLAPRLRQALGVDRPPGVSATTRLEVTEEPGEVAMSRLIVYVPAFNRTTDDWNPLVTRLREERALSESTWRPWNHGCGYLSTESAMARARALRAAIDEEFVDHGGFDDILLLGHSLGALLIRQAYLLAAGRFDGRRSEWVDKVRRIVLFAATNRGVDARRVWWMRALRQLYRFGHGLRLLPHFALADVLRGADFLTELRIEWIRYFRETEHERLPIVVQLLGTRDELVTRDDSIDLLQFPEAHYFDVPDATHRNLHRPDIAPHPEERYQFIRHAILGSLTTPESPRPVAEKSPVVFALHGIRASNSDWPHDVKREIERDNENAEVLIPTYGRFSMLNFTLPWVRRRNIPWFKDAYSEALARHPEAKFHFIGHSNGTYILGAALRDLPHMRFDRVTLVGSVLPREYPWEWSFAIPQVREVRDHRSRWDWPVAWLCSGLRGLGMRDIGTSGFDGFTYGGPELRETFYYRGDHSRPLKDDNLTALVNPLLTGIDTPDPAGSPLPRAPAYPFGLISRLMPFVAAPLIVALGFVRKRFTK